MLRKSSDWGWPDRKVEWAEVVGRIRSALEEIRAAVKAPHLVVRIGLTGASPLSSALIRDRDLLLAEAEQAAEQAGATWVEKLESDVAAPGQEAVADAADPILELADRCDAMFAPKGSAPRRRH